MGKVGRKTFSKFKQKKKIDKTVAKRENKHHTNSKFIRRSKQMENNHKVQLQNWLPHKGSITGFDIKSTDILDGDDPTELPFYDRLINSTFGGLERPADVSEDQYEVLGSTNNNINQQSLNESLNASNNQEQFNIYKNILDHFSYTLTSKDIEKLISEKPKECNAKWNGLGLIRINVPNIIKTCSNSQISQPSLSATDVLSHVKSPLNINFSSSVTPLEAELLHVLNNYQDLYFSQRSDMNSEALMNVYCLHTLNHILKSKALIMKNNDKISATAKTMNLTINEVLLGDNYQDQGLMRLKILILVPFRESVLSIIKKFVQLMYGNDAEQCINSGKIINYKRFLEEYKCNTLHFPKTNKKPLDYEKLFSGNVDDNFKLGIRFSKKSMSLYSDLNDSDILIASPLGLRKHIGNVDSKSKNYDFLNSIEVLIIDQTEMFMAQNWDTLLYVLDHIHLQPQKFPQTNCQRVRNSSLSGHSKFYRQTVLLSSHDLPEFRSVVNNKCSNYAGSVSIENPIEIGDMNNVIVRVRQTFKQINCSSLESVFEDRFQYFVNEVLPQFRNISFAHCLIFVPSYFDFVRLRNLLKGESINYVQISEYTKDDKVARARDMFYHSGATIMLYSERAHFYRRRRIKGIRHIIFYQPPNWPNFYSEMTNFMMDTYQNSKDGLSNSMSITVLYTKYDVISLCNIVGTELAKKLIQSNKSMYFFSSADPKG